MRLILFDRATEARRHFFPLTLSRPLWELRCGITSLEDKLQAKVGATDLAYFLPDYLAETYRRRTNHPVNDTSVLTGDDLLLVDARVKADTFAVPPTGAGQVTLDDQDQLLCARIPQTDAQALPADDFETFLDSVKAKLPQVEKQERTALADELAVAASAVLVGLTGRVAILYRPHPEKPVIELPA